MKRCWENEPKNRPSFTQIVEALGLMLGIDEELPGLEEVQDDE
jgi:hypothetical protein